MSAAIGVAPLERARPFAAGAAAAVALVGLAALLQIRCGAIGDVSWLITVDEKWLGGARPYVDIVETNPPAALLLYWPQVALARTLGLAPEALVALSGFAAAAAALTLAASVLGRAGLLPRPGPASLALALVATLILPGRAFDERDVFAAYAGLPLIAVAIARACGARVSLDQALAAGLSAGLMVAIKPPYALVLLALAPYVAARAGWRGVLTPEWPAALALLVVYAVAGFVGFPDYFAHVLPEVAAVYAPARAPFGELILNVGVILGAAMAMALVVFADDEAASPLVVAPALAALGAFAAYLAQGKGWLYQIYPMAAFLALGFALTLARRGEAAQWTRMALAFLAAALGAAAVDGWAIQIAVAVAGLAAFIAPGAGAAPVKTRLAAALAPAALGALSAVYFQPLDGEGDAGLARALARLGAHPSVAAISDGLALGHPLVRRAGAIWAQRDQAMLMAAAARYRLSRDPDNADLRARMEAAMRADRDRLADDIRRNRPDAILVGRTGTRFHAWAWADPVLGAARADYVFFADNGDPRWPAEVWARKDLVGLRPGVGEASTAK